MKKFTIEDMINNNWALEIKTIVDWCVAIYEFREAGYDFIHVLPNSNCFPLWLFIDHNNELRWKAPSNAIKQYTSISINSFLNRLTNGWNSIGLIETICIDNRQNSEELSVGRKYRVLNFRGGNDLQEIPIWVEVINNKESKKWYFAKRFEKFIKSNKIIEDIKKSNCAVEIIDMSEWIKATREFSEGGYNYHGFTPASRQFPIFLFVRNNKLCWNMVLPEDRSGSITFETFINNIECNMKLRDVIVCIDNSNVEGELSKGSIYKRIIISGQSPTTVTVENNYGIQRVYGASRFKNHKIPFLDIDNYIKTKIKGDKKMKEIIVKNFPKTADAILVEKHLGKEIQDTFTNGLIVAKHRDEYLAEAKRREKIFKEEETDPRKIGSQGPQ